MTYFDKKNKLNKIFVTIVATMLGLLFIGPTGCKTNDCGTKTAQNSDKIITLANAGKTEYVIVTARSPIPAEKTAATELANYLTKVTGAEFKIVQEGTGSKPSKGIYVGWTTFTNDNGCDSKAFAPEEWLVTTVDENIVLTGGRPRGSLNAVYQFLEELVGVHLLDPQTEVIPVRDDLTIDAPNLSGKPAFLLHGVHAPSTLLFYPYWRSETDAYFHQFNNNDFLLGKTKYGTSLKTGSPAPCHSLGFYIHPSEYGSSHPEYFAMHKKVDGTLYRNTDAKGTKNFWFDLCLSNPELRKIISAKLRDYIKADRKKAQVDNRPPPFIYSIDQNDCLPNHGCLCAECRKIVEREGAESGLMIDFINEIADSIKDDYPEILIQTFAYNHTLKPPKTIRPRDNVMIRWCDHYGNSEFTRPLTHEYNQHMRDMFETWAKISKNMAVWDYWRRFTPHATGFYIPTVNISCLKPDLEYFQANGAKSIFAESEYFNCFGKGYMADDFHSFQPLRVWLGIKLTQNPQRDEKTLLDIFFKGYYGPAANKMRELLAYIEKRQNDCNRELQKLPRENYYQAYLDLDFFRTARKLLAEAEAACDTNKLFRAHVIRERIPVNSALLFLEPSLRKTFCASGERYPFDRSRILEEYASDWSEFMNVCMTEKTRKKAKGFVEKCLAYLRSMPMITAANINHKATSVLGEEIQIDGALDETAWADSAKLFLTPLDKMEKLKVKTTVRVLWSKEKLYLAFECFEDRIQDMKFQKRGKNDTNISLDSSIEIFLNPSGDRRNYFQILVNPAGSVVNNKVTTLEGKKSFDTSWNSGVELVTKINPDSWVVEVAIPFKALNAEGKKNATIVANFCRSRVLKAPEPGVAKGDSVAENRKSPTHAKKIKLKKPTYKEDKTATQLQTWSPLLVHGFHDLPKFGTITLAGKGNDVLFTSFEGPHDSVIMTSRGGCTSEFSKEPRSRGGQMAATPQDKKKVGDGLTSLRLTFPKTQSHTGVAFNTGAQSDWSGYSAIKADMYLEGSTPRQVLLRLDDDKPLHYGSLNLKPGWNKDIVLENLAKVGKKVSLSKVKSFYLYMYTKNEKVDRVIFLDNIRFVRKKK